MDPVPFLVVSLLGFTVAFSYGPIYLMALGLSLRPALAACSVAVAGIVAASHYRYVWTARPDLREEVPVDARLKRLFYAVFLVIGALVLLAIPLLAR